MADQIVVGDDFHTLPRKYKDQGDGTWAEVIYNVGPGAAIFSKAGTISDADFTVTPPVGTMAVDTTNSFLYVRTAAATWKKVAIA